MKTLNNNHNSITKILTTRKVCGFVKFKWINQNYDLSIIGNLTSLNQYSHQIYKSRTWNKEDFNLYLTKETVC